MIGASVVDASLICAIAAQRQLFPGVYVAASIPHTERCRVRNS